MKAKPGGGKVKEQWYFKHEPWNKTYIQLLTWTLSSWVNSGLGQVDQTS